MLGGEPAESYPGTQGDPLDTQWDMAFALLGASVAQLLSGRGHDRQVQRVELASSP